MGVIYKITNPTGRLYVGKTYNLAARIASHKCCAKKTTKAIILYNSIRKYGWDAHVLEVLEDVPDDQLNVREMFWIAELKTYCYENPNGMNMTKGGDGQRTTWMHDIERRKRQSERFTGSGGAFYGHHHTEENKKKASIRVSKFNKENGIKVPEWGAEKGRNIVRKKILCYNENGVFIKEYPSLQSAENELNIDHSCISEACTRKRTNAGGYLFRYKEGECVPNKIDPGVVKRQTEKRPVLFLNDEFEIMATYPSAIEASAELEVPITSIRRAALYNYLWPIRTGHVFIYKDIYESLNLDN